RARRARLGGGGRRARARRAERRRADDCARRRAAGEVLQAGGRSPVFLGCGGVGACILALVLTGMGSDGAGGAGEIVSVGGGVIVQDEASSVVWGMPGTVAHAGLASAVLPLDQIGPKIVQIFSGGRP